MKSPWRCQEEVNLAYWEETRLGKTLRKHSFNLQGYGKKLKSNPGNWLHQNFKWNPGMTSPKSVWLQLPSSIVQDWDTFDWIRRYHKVRKIELYKLANFSKMRHPCAKFSKDEWKYRWFPIDFFFRALFHHFGDILAHFYQLFRKLEVAENNKKSWGPS